MVESHILPAQNNAYEVGSQWHVIDEFMVRPTCCLDFAEHMLEGPTSSWPGSDSCSSRSYRGRVVFQSGSQSVMFMAKEMRMVYRTCRTLGKCIRWTLLVAAIALEGYRARAEEAFAADGEPLDRTMELVFSGGKERLPPIRRVTHGALCTGEGTNDTYSVIVHSTNEHHSSLFRVPARLCAYSQGVAWVQIGSTRLGKKLSATPGSPAFGLAHPPGASKRVRIYHAPNALHPPGARELSQLEVSCKDPTETTVVVISDETCSYRFFLDDLPSACWAHVARRYPYSSPRFAPEPRFAYLPLGPRNTFDYVNATERAAKASERPRFFNVAVTSATAPRRVKLLNEAKLLKRVHPDWGAYVSSSRISSSQYRSTLLESTLTVCPGGHNPETFRMFEALEAGSIPVVSRQDYLYPSYMAPFPCGAGNVSWATVAASPFAKEVSVGTWDEVPGLFERLKDMPGEYIDKLQADSVAWYEALMRRSYLSILNFGQGYELWPQDGPIVLEGFSERSEPYPETPSYRPGEVRAGEKQMRDGAE